MSTIWKNIAPLDRWKPTSEHSIPYKTFKEYEQELFRIIKSFESAKSFTYHNLKALGALWDSPACDFGLSPRDNVLTIKQWSGSYNDFGNWFRLSLLMSISSMLETYLACMVKECIESDPGILIGSTRSIDGMSLILNSVPLKSQIEVEITNCTKGDWSSRKDHLIKLFGQIPPSLLSAISDLDKVRKLRNDFGHAFGRDIELSREYYQITKSPINKLSVKTFNRYRTIVKKVVSELDKQLVANHIGAFEELLLYHRISSELSEKDKGQKMVAFKKALYDARLTHGCNKDFCRAVIQYYDSLL